MLKSEFPLREKADLGTGRGVRLSEFLVVFCDAEDFTSFLVKTEIAEL